ncbi:MAG: hypothetical protein AAFY34_04345 [Pseudomonadota bacterium]
MIKHLVGAIIVAALTLSPAVTAQQIDGSLFSGMKARLVGPATMSGRIAAVDAAANDPNFIVAGASTGGVWISRNGGLNWTPVFDDQPVASIGAVSINQQNPDIIWVGTGEGNVRNSTSVGGGVYKSLDGGKTWDYVGLRESERIHRIALHPTDPDIAYVAALGPLWGDGETRGLFRTEDGGETWEKILYVDERTGATDIRMVPGNPQKLFAGMWEFRRQPFFFKSGGPGSGVYMSLDGGDTWTEITEEDGLPKGELGRSSFAISPANPDRIYALIEAEESALARSDDGGESWSLVNTDYDINDRPFYYGDISVDPVNPNLVYRIGSRVKVSEDGGKTFEYMPAIDCCAASNTIHIDTHAWWINPNNPKHMIDGNDGGIAITQDGGETWRFVRNLPLAQFYHIAVDNEVPYNILGGLQDNGSWRGPSEVFENGGIRNFHWQEVAFGDGFDTIADTENSRRGYAMSQGGVLYRWDLNIGESRLIKPDRVEGVDLRYNWNAGFAQDPFDASTIYLGSQFVHKSTDRGLTWEVISADLTTNNPDTQTFRESGGLTPDVTAAENYNSITMIVPSPVEQGVIWVGTDDGRVHITRDGGASWSSLADRVRGGPDNPWVSTIFASPHDASVAYVTLDNHRNDDMGTYVYRVSNYGRTWTSIATDDITGYAASILQDSEDPNLLFLGTEFGLHVSLNGGRSWTKWTAGVPTVQIADIVQQTRESDIVLGTHGRAAFVIEDVSALRGLSASAFNQRFQLLDVSDAQQYRWSQTPSSRFPGSGEFRAENAPYGAMVTFIASGEDLPHPDEMTERERKIAVRTTSSSDDETDETPETPKLTVEIRDSTGTLIRTFKSGVHQGINRVMWDLSRDGLMPIDAGDAPEDGTLPPGRQVLPGTYQITTRFEDSDASGQVVVRPDPRSPYSAQAHAANDAFRGEIEALRGRMNTALLQINGARRDIATIEALIAERKRLQSVDAEDEDHPLNILSKQAGELKSSLDESEELFRVPDETKGIVFNEDKAASRLGFADFYAGSTFDQPSAAARAEVAVASETLEDAITELNTILGRDLVAFRTLMLEEEIDLLDQSPVTE